MGTIKTDGLYCMYLRKSRRDVELEQLGQGETLARHERQLSDLARRLGVVVSHTYREIVSGDTIAARPEMQRLLEDINRGLWDGVLVMDVDRLARGDSIDQGIIMQTMLYAGALVITPDKVYDPNDESDADFFEIKLFFARREYAAIKKRLQRGRIASVMDGCYLGPDIYGYRRVKLQGRKGWSLQIVPEQAEIVRSVFAWYAYGMDGREVGAAIIANRLNDMGLKTNRGNAFEASYIRQMLQNPTYVGKVRWNARTKQTSIVDGQRVSRRPVNDHPIIVDGLHEAIVDADLFQRVQALFENHAKRPRNVSAPVANSLGGLVICGQCGRFMQLKPDAARRDAFLYCPRAHCPTCSTYVSVVEGVILDGLREWVAEYETQPEVAPALPAPDTRATEAARAQLMEELEALEKQSGRLYDLLERGLYSEDVFLARRADLDGRIADARERLEALAPKTPDDPIGPIIPQVRTVLAAYDASATPAEKYALFHSVIDHVTYNKTQRCYRNNAPTDFLELTIFPKVPDSSILTDGNGF